MEEARQAIVGPIERAAHQYSQMCRPHETMSREARVKAKLRDDRRVATGPNETWALDFGAVGPRQLSNLVPIGARKTALLRAVACFRIASARAGRRWRRSL